MLTGQKHIVKRQVYNISVDTQQNSHDIYQKISALNSSVILPLVDKACCELNTDGSNIRIDKLEIDLGNINFNDIDTQIEEIFYSKFCDKLSHEITANIAYEDKGGITIKASRHTKIEKLEFFLKTGTLPWWHSKNEVFDITTELDELVENHPDEIKAIFTRNPDNAQLIRRVSYLLDSSKLKEWLIKLFPLKADEYSYLLDDLFLFAEAKGILNFSWQHSLIAESILTFIFSPKEISDSSELSELIQNLLIGLCENNRDKFDEIIESPVKFTSKYKSVLPILVKHLKSNLLETKRKKGHVKFESVEDKKKHFESESIQDAETSSHLTKVEILKQDADKELISPEQFKEKTSLVSSQKSESEINEEFDSPINLKGKTPFANNEKPKGETPDTDKGVTSLEQLKEKFFADIKESSTYDERNSTEQETETIANKDGLEKELKDVHDQKTNKLPSSIKDAQADINYKNIQTPDDLLQNEVEDIYIENAGLILLYPFLKKLFVKLYLYSANGWSTNNGYDKAIHLLQYMAAGSQKLKEHQLPLNKILCGSDIFYPVQPEVLLNETEIKESDELLKSTIANWSVLKNTSIEGFRVSFLQREGRLTKGENCWNLFIERKSYDVLLDRLPWAISVIKLEWMPKPIFTEW